jgi:hypothetical protein
MIIEYVWKREIFTDPLLPPGCDVGWCDRASLGGGSPIGRRARYSDGGRGPDWRRCRFTRKVRVRCNLWRLKRGDEKISSRLLYWRRGGGPDWRRCWFIRKVRERCCIWRLKRREKKFRRTCYRLLGVPHNIDKSSILTLTGRLYDYSCTQQYSSWQVNRVLHITCVYRVKILRWDVDTICHAP